MKFHEEKQRAAEAPKKGKEEAKQAFQTLPMEKEGFDKHPNSRNLSSVPHISHRESKRAHDPNDGMNKPLEVTFDHRHSPEHVKFGNIFGRAVDWFELIELFHALGYRASKFPGEKLSILKGNVRGETVDIVYGLDGGEDAQRCFISDEDDV